MKFLDKRYSRFYYTEFPLDNASMDDHVFAKKIWKHMYTRLILIDLHLDPVKVNLQTSAQVLGPKVLDILRNNNVKINVKGITL